METHIRMMKDGNIQPYRDANFECSCSLIIAGVAIHLNADIGVYASLLSSAVNLSIRNGALRFPVCETHFLSAFLRGLCV
jgi:hypothetical protein